MKNLFLVAQDMQSLDDIVSQGVNGACFDVQWSRGFQEAVRRAVLRQEKKYEVLRAAVMRRYYHGDRSDAFQRVVFAESHESAREQGGRISQPAIAHARKRSFLATALSFVTPGIPMLLQGSELWNEDPLDAPRSLQWQELDTEGGGGIRRRLRDLIALRQNLAGTTRGLTGHECSVRIDGDIFIVERWALGEGGEHSKPGNHVIAIANFADSGEPGYEVSFPKAGDWHVRFNADCMEYDGEFGEWNSGPIFAVTRGTYRVPVGPLSLVILSQDS